MSKYVTEIDKFILSFGAGSIAGLCIWMHEKVRVVVSIVA